MALSCLKVRILRGTVRQTQRQTQRHSRCMVRAQASCTAVKFKLHRHVEYGQSLLLVGSVPELGAWDAKQALELQWGEGDNWALSAALPLGAGVEYKYIIKRRDGLDWCPGQNKSITLPLAASVEVMDAWDNPHSNVVILIPLDAAPVGVVELPAAVTAIEGIVTEAEAPASIIAEELLPASGNGYHGADVLVASGNSATREAITAVSTVENLHVPELENGASHPAVPAAPAQPQHQPQPPPTSGFLANNIVQGVPMGAVAVSQDPITQYEEADKYQVVEVGLAEKAASAIATEARATDTATRAKSLDKMTMAELRTEVKRRGMSPLGNRRELLTRLQNAGIV